MKLQLFHIIFQLDEHFVSAEVSNGLTMLPMVFIAVMSTFDIWVFTYQKGFFGALPLPNFP